MSVIKNKNIMYKLRNVFSLFFVFSIVLLYSNFMLISAEEKKESDAEKKQSQQPEQEKQEFIYDSHGKKDPFSPPVIISQEKLGTESLAGIKLEGIIWDEDNPIAVINGKVVGISDEINGAKIVQIKQNEVIFEINGQRMPVKLQMKVD